MFFQKTMGGDFSFSSDFGNKYTFSTTLSNDQNTSCKKSASNQPIYNDWSDHTFVAFHDVYLSDQQGAHNTWAAISDFSNMNVPENWFVESLVVYPGDNNIVYAAFAGPTWNQDMLAWNGGCKDDDNNPGPAGNDGCGGCTLYKKLFKTEDALSENPTWVDMTPGFDDAPDGATVTHAVRWKGITDLAISDSNPDNIYASFDQLGHTDGDISQGIIRVTASHDGGATWVDYSKGLPAFPVNSLVYYNGSKNGLFAGTDLGVYYTDDNLYNIENPENGGWVCVSNGLPPSIVSDIDINYCRQLIRISTFGRGMWEADLKQLGVETDMIVDQDATWDTPRDITGNITVTNGAKLTITNTIYMAKGKAITVKPGSKLDIDGGTITNACGSLWDGIYVEGNSNQTQSVSKQGYLKIRNGSIIKNAYQGVVNYGLKANGDTDWNKTGGIILAYNSTFLNNRWDVSFLKYQQFYTSGSPRPDKSGFYGCDFIDNDNFVKSSSPGRSIGLDRVHNVKIKGCTFLDYRDDPDYIPQNGGDNGFHLLPSYKAGIGIVAGQCNFTVDNYLDSTSEFLNLKYGIKAYDYDAASIKIKNADFNCYKGVYLNGINGAQVNFNNFFVAEESTYAGDDIVFSAYGVYLDMCRNYEVTENNFNSNSADDEDNIPYASSAYGVVVYNRHGEASKIYNNKFDNFYVATEAIGQNKNETQPTGLEFRCNTYTNSKYDVFVTPEFYNPGPTDGIAFKQGALSQNTEDMAGNLFGNASPYLESNYLNNGDFLFYIHHKESSEPDVVPLKYSNIALWEVSTEDFDPVLSCPLQNTGGGGGDEIKIAALKSTAETSANEIVQIDNQLATLVDGGNTESLENDVILTDNADAWKKYQQLMANAGYLSDEVLDEVSKKETGFNKPMIRNVLVANPQAAKSGKVQENLDNRGDQLPDYMRDQIDMGLTKMSSKEYLELVKATHQTRHDAAIDQLVGLLKSDTLNDRSAEIVNALSNTGKVAFDYKLVAYYDAHNQSNLADVLLEVIDGYNLSDHQQQYFDNYNAFRNLTAQWKQAEVNMAELDSAKLQELKVYAELNNSVAAKAIALQHLNGDYSYIEPIYDPEGGDKSNTQGRRKRTVVDENKLLLFPNPANGYFTVEYNLIDPFNKAVIVVFDISGKMVFQQEIHYDMDQVLIPSENWPSGHYTVSLFADKKTVITKKITLSK